MIYQIAVKPSYNIAYYDRYLEMCQIELRVVLTARGVAIKKVSLLNQNKGEMIVLETETPLKDKVLKVLAELSFFYMLFEEMEGGVLKPLITPFEPQFPDDLSIRMKYNGKTNATLTRTMLNLAYAVSDFKDEAHIKVLDPLCGRGTTLFEAMISGFDAYGVDRDQNGVAELGTYITRYVKEARLKHTNKRGKLITEGKHIGDTFELQYAKEKQDFKSGNLRELKVVKADTTNFVGAFRQKYIHVLVADFPYNVQHSAKGNPDANGLAWLLEKGLEAWYPFLKKGAGVAISWNLFTDKRESFEKILEAAGFEVMNDQGMNNLSHRVAQAINRDIIIAKKL